MSDELFVPNRLGHSLADRIDATGPCWLWTGSRDTSGYAHLRWKGGERYGHRFVYELLVGEIPEGMQLDHLCRVRHCVNPDHLEVVTVAENIRRGHNVNRNKTHCIRGHLYDEANTYVDSNGGRQCRACRLLWYRQNRKKDR